MGVDAGRRTTSLTATEFFSEFRNTAAARFTPLSGLDAHRGTRISGNSCATSAARDPDAATSPDATAASKLTIPVTSSSQTRGDISTTLGGVPRVCRGPGIHCTATNGGTLTSTDAPGANCATVRADCRTAAARVARSGWGSVSSASQPTVANTAARICAGSTVFGRVTCPWCTTPNCVEPHMPANRYRLNPAASSDRCCTMG